MSARESGVRAVATRAGRAAARCGLALALLTAGMIGAIATSPAQASGASAADSAGAGWRTSSGILTAPAVPAVELEVHWAKLRPTWRDVAFAAGAAGAGVLVGAHDVDFASRFTAHDSQAQRELARYVKPFGQEVVVSGAILAWAGARLAHRPELLARVERADLSIAAAAGCMFALKEIVGRTRPEQSPDDAGLFDPFSNHDSFPSGHTTLAFAAATALTRETSSRWVPAVVYPIAGLVGWSRLHDHKHWPSDVLSGAAIGFGVTWKVEDALRPASGEAIGRRVDLEFATPGTLAAVRMRW